MSSASTSASCHPTKRDTISEPICCAPFLDLIRANIRAIAEQLWQSLPSDRSVLAQLEHSTVRNIDAPLLASVARVVDEANDLVRRQMALHVFFRTIDASISVVVRPTPESLEYQLVVLTHPDGAEAASLIPQALSFLERFVIEAKHVDVRQASREYLAFYRRSGRP